MGSLTYNQYKVTLSRTEVTTNSYVNLKNLAPDYFHSYSCALARFKGHSAEFFKDNGRNNLLALGVAALLGLQLLLSEADAEEPQEVSVGGLDVGVSLDEGLPLLHHRPELVRGQVHSVEVGQAVLALDILAQELELLERSLSVLHEKKRYFS